MGRMLLILFVCFGVVAETAPSHLRDKNRLTQREQEFCENLSVKQRRIFVGRFNQTQRDLTLKYVSGRGKDKCYSPDEAVTKVMEETGMSLAVKSRKETEQH